MAPWGANLGPLIGCRSWDFNMGMLLGNVWKGILFWDLAITALWVTMLSRMVKSGCELVLLAVYYFWYVSGVLFLFACLLEMICLASEGRIFTGFFF